MSGSIPTATSSSASPSPSPSSSILISNSLSLPPAHSAADHCHAILTQLQQILDAASLSLQPGCQTHHDDAQTGDNDDDDDIADVACRHLAATNLLMPDVFPFGDVADVYENAIDFERLPRAVQCHLRSTNNTYALLHSCMQILDRHAAAQEGTKGEKCTCACGWMNAAYIGSTDEVASVPTSPSSSSSSCSASSTCENHNTNSLQCGRLTCLAALWQVTSTSTSTSMPTSNDAVSIDESTSATPDSSDSSASFSSPFPFPHVWMTLIRLLPLAIKLHMLPIQTCDYMQERIHQAYRGCGREARAVARSFIDTCGQVYGVAGFIHQSSVALAILVTDVDNDPHEPRPDGRETRTGRLIRAGFRLRRYSPPSTVQQQTEAATVMRFLLTFLCDTLQLCHTDTEPHCDCDSDSNSSRNERRTESGEQSERQRPDECSNGSITGHSSANMIGTPGRLVTARLDRAEAQKQQYSEQQNSPSGQQTTSAMETYMKVAVQICMEQVQCLLFYVAPFSSALSPLIGRTYHRLSVCSQGRTFDVPVTVVCSCPLLGVSHLHPENIAVSHGRSSIFMHSIICALLEASEEEIVRLPCDLAWEWSEKRYTGVELSASELLHRHLLGTLMAWQKQQKQRRAQLVQTSEAHIHHSPAVYPNSSSAARQPNLSSIPFDTSGGALASATSAAVKDLEARSVYDWRDIRVPSHLHIWLRCLLDALPRLLVSRHILHAFYPTVPNDKEIRCSEPHMRCGNSAGLHALVRLLDQPSMHKHINLHEHVGSGGWYSELTILTALFSLPTPSLTVLASYSSQLLRSVGLRLPHHDSLPDLPRRWCYDRMVFSLIIYSFPSRHPDQSWRYDWIAAMLDLPWMHLRRQVYETRRQLMVHLREEKLDPERDPERAQDWLYFIRWLDDYASSHPDTPYFGLRGLVTEGLASEYWPWPGYISFARLWLLDHCQFTMDTDWMLFTHLSGDYVGEMRTISAERIPRGPQIGKPDEIARRAQMHEIVEEAVAWWYKHGLAQIRSTLECDTPLIPDLASMVMDYAMHPCMRDPHAAPPHPQPKR